MCAYGIEPRAVQISTQVTRIYPGDAYVVITDFRQSCLQVPDLDVTGLLLEPEQYVTNVKELLKCMQSFIRRGIP